MTARARSLVTLLALLAAAAAALGLAWWGVDRRGAAEGARQEQARRLWDLSPADVAELRLTARGASARLTRTAAGWRIEPPGEEADRGAVDLLVERLARLERKDQVAPGGDAAALAAFGLSAPRASAELLAKGGRRETLALGDASPFDGSLYLGVTSGAVVRVAGDLAYWLDRRPEELRDRTVLRFDRDQVTGLRLLASGRTALEVRRKPGPGLAAWELTAPRSGPASEGRVAQALTALSALRALRFADDAGARAAALGLSPPARAVVLLAGEKELGRLELGKEANDSLYARSSAGPRIVEVDRAALAPLDAALDAWQPPPADRGPATAEPGGKKGS